MTPLIKKWQFNIGYIKLFIVLLLLSVTMLLSGVIDVDIPTVNVNTNEFVEIPITMVGTEQGNVFSIYTEIHFNPVVVRPIDVSIADCITDNWGAPSFNIIEDGILSIAFFGTTSLLDDGDICKINFEVISEMDAVSAVTFVTFVLNEGIPEANDSDGEIIVTHRIPTIEQPANVSVSEGDLIDFAVNATDPFDLALSFEAINLPEEATFLENEEGKYYLQWQTTFSSAGEYSIGFSTTNTESFSDTVYVDILVENILDVWLPTIEISAPANITIPISANEVGGQDIYSFYTKVLYDSLIILPTNVSISGTICEGWGNLSYNINNSGEILISMFGTTELIGNGDLVNIEFETVTTNNSFSDLEFDFFVFNEGTPQTDLTNGIVYVGTPYADFSVNYTEGNTPFTVEFYDLSVAGINPITNWLWNFGDGETSNLQNPIHSYNVEGVYSVSLTITNSIGSDEEIKTDYITVNNSSPIVANAIDNFDFDEDTIDFHIDLNNVFYDYDNDVLEFSVSNQNHISCAISDGIVILTPAENWFGEETLIFTATEYFNRNSISDTVLVLINSVNDLPIVINPIPNIVFEMNDNYTTISLNEVFFDVETSNLNFTVENENNLYTIINGDKTVTISALTDWSGSETLFFIAEDNAGAIVQDYVNVTVLQPYQVFENFDDGGNIPDGWTTQHFNTTADPWHLEQQNGEDYCWDVSNSFLQSANAKLISPIYDLSGYSNISLSFFSELQPNSNYSATIEMSLNGVTWNTIHSLTEATNENLSYDISNSADGEEIVQFRWVFQTEDFSYNYWKIDDFVISGVVDFSAPPTTISDLALVNNDLVSAELSWSPATDNNFQQYEIFYSLDEIVTDEDFLWSIEEDENLANIAETTTTLTNLTPNSQYWFAIRGVDSFGNVADLSNVVSAILAALPVASSPFPTQESLNLNCIRTVEIGISFVDDYLVDASSIQYRIDKNGDGIYNESELWTDISQENRKNIRYQDADSLMIREFVTFNSDGDMLNFEFRATDTIRDIYCYSGTNNEEGIEDDYYVSIDTTPPTTISDFDIVDAIQNSVFLIWNPVAEQHFSHYEIYYNNHPDIDTSDILWSVSHDQNLNDINTNSTQITGLSLEETCYFKIRGVDQCGFGGELSNLVVSITHETAPLCFNPFPQNQPNPDFENSLTVEIGCTFSDYYGINPETVQYRFDKNGDGIYNDEGWLNYVSEVRKSVILRNENDTLFTRQAVAYVADGENLHFEFRAWDIDGFGPIYSGDNSDEGIADDWIVKIDTTPPTDISVIATTSPTETSLGVGWYVSSDAHFSHYELYYDTDFVVDTTDSVWDYNDDANLGSCGENFVLTYVTDLEPETTYYFRVQALDVAGNASELSTTASGTTLENSFAPLSPGNITIEVSGNNVILTWDPVTHDTENNEITVSSYRIYWGDNPDVSLSNYEAVVTEPYFEHINGANSQRVFYKITAVSSVRNRNKKSVELFKDF